MSLLIQALTELRRHSRIPLPTSEMALIKQLMIEEFRHLEASCAMNEIGGQEREQFERTKIQLRTFFDTDDVRTWGWLIELFQAATESPVAKHPEGQ
ncbi:hypothetical protein [Pseudomonas sp. NPDC086251]|uniref:hypothetical protein n=1 Tax=Pseudomonas sp. NPDC086251 TaxID=3364431 RepID=UPI0038372BD6